MKSLSYTQKSQMHNILDQGIQELHRSINKSPQRVSCSPQMPRQLEDTSGRITPPIPLHPLNRCFEKESRLQDILREVKASAPLRESRLTAQDTPLTTSKLQVPSTSTFKDSNLSDIHHNLDALQQKVRGLEEKLTKTTQIKADKYSKYKEHMNSVHKKHEPPIERTKTASLLTTSSLRGFRGIKRGSTSPKHSPISMASPSMRYVSEQSDRSAKYMKQTPSIGRRSPTRSSSRNTRREMVRRASVSKRGSHGRGYFLSASSSFNDSLVNKSIGDLRRETLKNQDLRNKCKKLQEELIRQRKKNHELNMKLSKCSRQMGAKTKERKRMERMEQEYRDLWESFERSEAIRKQQKEMIAQLKDELQVFKGNLQNIGGNKKKGVRKKKKKIADI